MNTETLTLAKRELEHMGYSDIIISHDELHVQVWNKENAPLEYGDDERGCDLHHQLKDDSL